MKKFFSTVCALYMLTSIAYAQLGFKAGLNFSNLSNLDDDERYDEDYQALTRVHFGPTLEIPLNEKVRIQTGLLYSGKGYMESYNDNTDKLRLNYLEVPLSVCYFHPIKENIKVFAHLGGYGGVLYQGTFKKDYDGDLEIDNIDIGNTNSDDYQRLDFGGSLGAGVEYSNFRLGLGYNFGIKNIEPGSHGSDNLRYRTKAFQLSVGYVLSKKQ